jgi:hypothetical protein
MIKKTRISFTVLAILFASTSAFVAVSDVAAARGGVHASHTPLPPGSASNNTIRPIVNSRRHSYDRTLTKRKRTETHAKNTVECIKAPCSLDGSDQHTKHGHRQADSGSKGKAAETPIASRPPAVPGTAGNNTIHPIVTSKPAQPTAAAPIGTGRLSPSDPVGNTHPTAGANPPTVVTVSNGVSAAQIQNGPGGVVVYSEKPGTITVDNGKEKTTLSGGSVTLSGNVMGVGAGQGIEVGKPNSEGKTVVAIKPTPEPPQLNTNSEDLRKGFYKGCTPCEVFEGINDFGYGVAHGFAPGPVPPPKTSTTTQQ